MPIARSDVEHIARLARIALDEERLPDLAQQLDRILAHIAVLATAVQDSAVPAAEAAGVALPLRADEGPCIPLSRPLDTFAPEMRDGFFLVPRLETHEESPE